jgi:hypothetical protein
MEVPLVNLQADKEQFLWMEMPLMNFQVDKVQPLQMEVPQLVTFSNIVDSLKAMSLTSQACFELKSFDYGAITIEFVNFFPTNLMVTYYLSFLLFIIHWDNPNNCKVWTESLMVMLGVSCRLVTSRIHLDWAS